jgi:hypothetical protein
VPIDYRDPVEQKVTAEDEELLQEIRDRYRYYDDAWKEIREESRLDRKYLSGDPWDEKDRKAREDVGRPCISHDELNQYVNQAANNVRQNKRGIKVNPEGNGANDKSAEFEENLIRTIEYRSHAQNAYITAYENMLEGSYGWVRVTRRYLTRGSKNQEIRIKNIANPDSVLFDPDCKEADWSDARGCFVLDPVPKEEFKRRYPKAQIRDFTSEHMRVAKDWLQDKQVLVAEYWRVEVDDSEEGRPERKVTQYITNGIEILERLPQPGEIIAIIPFIGKQRYIDKGGVATRTLSSLVRLARDPQMSLAYLVTQQMEEAGLSPKVPYKGWKGQFESDADGWKNLNSEPRAFIQADYPDWALERGITVNLPTREAFTPNFEAYEVAKESARRAIQAAMGISPLPTSAQRQNEKSGVALEKITAQQDLGSFHFVDNFERGIELCGKVVQSWLSVTYDTEQEMALRQRDDKHKVVTLNTKEPYLDAKTNEMVHYPVTDEADHGLEVSAAPSYQSQRDEAASFLDTLIEHLQTLPLAPPQAAKLLSLAIQMRELGPKGDEMAEIISPTDPNQTGQAQQQLAAALQQAQQAGLLVQQLQAELQKLQLEKQGKIIDNEYRMSIEKLKIEAQVTMSEITTKSQQLNERIKFVEDVWQRLQEQTHEAGLQAGDQAHEQQMATQQAAATAAQSAQDAAQAPTDNAQA